MNTPANGGPVAFDLSDAEARIAADLPPFVFSYAGVVFQMRNPALAPIQLQEKLAATEDVDEIAKLMNEQLGEDLYTKLVDAGISQAGLKALIEQAVDAAGLGDLPNSSKPARRGSTRK